MGSGHVAQWFRTWTLISGKEAYSRENNFDLSVSVWNKTFDSKIDMVILKNVLISNFSQPTRNQVRHDKRFVKQWLLCYSWSKALPKM